MGRRKDNDRMFFSVTVCSCVQEKEKKKKRFFALTFRPTASFTETKPFYLPTLLVCVELLQSHCNENEPQQDIYYYYFFFPFFFYFLIYMQQQQLTFSDSAFNLFPLPPAISTAWYSCLGTPVVMFEMEYYYIFFLFLTDLLIFSNKSNHTGI